MSLRTRVALLVGGTVLLASLIGGIGIALSSRDVGTDRVDAVLRADAERLTTQVPGVDNRLRANFEIRRAACDNAADDDPAGVVGAADPADEPRGPRPAARTARFLPEFASSIQLVRANGQIVSGCLALPVSSDELQLAAAGTGEQLQTVTVDDERFRVLTTGVPNVGALQLARSLELTDDTVRSLFFRIALFGALGGLLAALIGWAAARRATRPIERLSAAADRVARTHDLGERIDVEGRDEIAGLAQSLNTMLGSLDTMRAQQHRLVQDASHELRTPLTSIRTNVDLLRRRPDIPTETRSEMLGDISAELDELTALTAELVDSATEVRTDPAQTTIFDLRMLVDECAQRCERRHARDVQVNAPSPQPTAVRGDRALIARAVTNLLSNAAKYTAASSGPIEVVVDGPSVSVLDRGPGVDDADLPHLFDRFYRATASRSAPGSGLGLAIVKQVVDGHGGTVTASNRPGGGFAIGFTLPQDDDRTELDA